MKPYSLAIAYCLMSILGEESSTCLINTPQTHLLEGSLLPINLPKTGNSLGQFSVKKFLCLCKSVFEDRLYESMLSSSYRSNSKEVLY